MLRILRAFAWMRWRIFVNSIEKTGARDRIERFSLAMEHLAPIVLVLVMVPSALALAALAGYAGYLLASGAAGSIAVQVLRFLLLGATAVAIVAQMVMPVADRTNPVRFLLLPIPRRTLYVAQASGTLTDPWVMVLVPMVFAVPIGMLVGGAYVAMLAALAAGILVLLAIIAVSALTTTLMHLLLRDRRRGELIALLFVLVLPLISFIPAAFDDDLGSRRRGAREQQARRRDPPFPSWVMTSARRTFSVLPSELYTSTITGASTGRVARAAGAGAGLLVSVAALHGVGLVLFGRVLATPATSGAKRRATNAALWTRVLPGVSAGASAVALAHVRLAIRTPRGRAILMSPLLMLVFFGFLALKAGDTSLLPFGWMRGGLGLAAFASAVSLLSILPIAMNQFAVDGAGLTLSLLSPLSTRQLLVGKAIGNGLVAVPTALFCVALAAAVFRGGSATAWLDLVLTLVATYILAAPATAAFSAIFPRVVDMNSIGNRSNAHGLSGLLGLAAFALAALPCIGLISAASLLGRPAAAPLLLMLWCGASLFIARLLMVPAEHIFDRRRENLALLM